MKKLMTAAACFCMLVVGCKNGQQQDEYTQTVWTNSLISTSSSMVCIGVEEGYAGECVGASLDSALMFQLLKDYVHDGILLNRKSATKKNVVTAMENAVKSDFAIVFYSGHGGQRRANDVEEVDGKDEYMCLYDKPLVDNDIWKILSKGRRVLLICDCCNSGTMFKAKPLLRSSKSSFSNIELQLLCWSGCPDGQYSYGSTAGGEFTNAIFYNFSPELTYEELWEKVSSDEKLKKKEIVQQTVIGDSSFLKLKAFR